MGDAAERSEGSTGSPGGWTFGDLIGDTDPFRILSRITSGDPLELAPACTRFLHEEALLMDADSLHERAAARIAATACDYDGEEQATWIRSRIDLAARAILIEEVEAERACMPMGVCEPRYEYLSYLLAVEYDFARRAAVEFNELPRECRAAFYALVLENKSVDECLEAGMGPKETLRDNANAAIDVLMKAVDKYEEPNG